MRVEIYTDGACSGNPGPGGWAAILMAGTAYKEISGYCEQTTNNRMELMAVIEGLSQLKYPCQVRLYSDSSYVISAFTKGWLANWKRQGWCKSNKEPVLNRDLFETLEALAQKHQIEWIKVAGHRDNPWNNRCDELAVKAYKERQAKR